MLDYIECNEVTPSLSQAIDLKELSEKHELDSDKIQEILSVRKPNQIPKISFHEEKIISLLPKNIEYDQIEDYVVKCMKFYSRYLKQKEKSAKMDARWGKSTFSTTSPPYNPPFKLLTVYKLTEKN